MLSFKTNIHIGQGYVHCAERLFQMDFNRHKAAGTLAAVFDATQVGSDKWARALDLTGLAVRDLAAQSPEEVRHLEAYASGVNSYLAERHPLPVEYRAVGITDPEVIPVWEPVHSLMLLRLHTTALGGSSSEAWEGELTRYLVQARVGVETATAWGLGDEGEQQSSHSQSSPSSASGADASASALPVEAVVLPSASSSLAYVVSGDLLQAGAPAISSTLVLEVS